jgi:hypothetical protein
MSGRPWLDNSLHFQKPLKKLEGKHSEWKGTELLGSIAHSLLLAFSVPSVYDIGMILLEL